MAVAGSAVVAYECVVLEDGQVHSRAVGSRAWALCLNVTEAVAALEVGAVALVGGPDVAQLRIVWGQRRIYREPVESVTP